MENLSAWRHQVTVLLFSDERWQIKFTRTLHRDSVPLNEITRQHRGGKEKKTFPSHSRNFFPRSSQISVESELFLVK